jgi:hypothetical protein
MMSVRDLLNKNKTLTGSVALCALLAALAALGFEVFGTRGKPADVSAKAFFTTEDQLTGADAMKALFVDDATKTPPFDHDGKPAYLAILYTCNGGKLKWISYLKRYTPAMRDRVQAAEDAAVAAGSKYAVPTSDFDLPGTEIKRPGPGPWIKPSDPQFSQTKTVNPPNDAACDDLDLYVP